jgi:hypothetical protein
VTLMNIESIAPSVKKASPWLMVWSTVTFVCGILAIILPLTISFGIALVTAASLPPCARLEKRLSGTVTSRTTDFESHAATSLHVCDMRPSHVFRRFPLACAVV